MDLRRIVAVGAVLVTALAGCGADDSASDRGTSASADTTTGGPPGPGPGPAGSGPVSEAAVEEFAAWYEAAVAEDGGELDPRFAPDDEAARLDAYTALIERLCGVQAGSPDRLRASATSIKDDSEFAGDEELARSAILEARTACGLDG